jgi:hypothetical protein
MSILKVHEPVGEVLLTIESNEIETDFIVATNMAIKKAEPEFEFNGFIVTVENALRAIDAIVQNYTLH